MIMAIGITSCPLEQAFDQILMARSRARVSRSFGMMTCLRASKGEHLEKAGLIGRHGFDDLLSQFARRRFLQGLD